MLDARDSAITSIQYTMTQVKHRTTEGTKLLAELYPGKVQKLDDPEAPARQDFTRMRQGEKDRLENIHYQDDLKTVAGHVLQTWDGSVGKQYVRESQSGRVQRQRFSVSDEMLERATFEFSGKTLAAWLREVKDTAAVISTGNLLEVTFSMMPSMTARCVLDKSKAYAVTQYDILRGGEVAYTASVQEFQRYSANGVDIYIPRKYESTMFYPRVNLREAAPTPDMVPLVKTQVTIQTVTLNVPIPDEQFEIQFPPNTAVYDEFLGQFIPTVDFDPVEASIRAQAEQWQAQLIQREAPAPGDPKNTADNEPSPTEPATGAPARDGGSVICIGSLALILCFIAVMIIMLSAIVRYVRRRN